MQSSDYWLDSPNKIKTNIGPCKTCKNAVFVRKGHYANDPNSWYAVDCPHNQFGWALTQYTCSHYEYEIGTDDEENVPWEKRFPDAESVESPK